MATLLCTQQQCCAVIWRCLGEGECLVGVGLGGRHVGGSRSGILMALHTLLGALTYITPVMRMRICDVPFKTGPCITIIASRYVQCALRSNIWGIYEARWHIWGMHSTYRHTGGCIRMLLLWTSQHWFDDAASKFEGKSESSGQEEGAAHSVL